MMDLKDRNIRKALLEKYLEGDTDAAQEKLLAEYFASVGPDEEERPVARLLLAERSMFSAAGHDASDEFDRIVAAHSRKRKRLSVRIAAFAASFSVAAAVLLMVSVRTDIGRDNADAGFGTIEIARSIQELMDLGICDIESITAKPSGSEVLLEVRLTDGSTRTYLMTKNAWDSSTSLTAINE